MKIVIGIRKNGLLEVFVLVEQPQNFEILNFDVVSTIVGTQG